MRPNHCSKNYAHTIPKGFILILNLVFVYVNGPFQKNIAKKKHIGI